MPESSSVTHSLSGITSLSNQKLAEVPPLQLAQALSEQLTITDRDWHRLKGNRKARAKEQIAAALVFLLKDEPEEALQRLHQATGWLDHSLSAPPCPSHGHHGK